MINLIYYNSKERKYLQKHYNLFKTETYQNHIVNAKSNRI